MGAAGGAHSGGKTRSWGLCVLGEDVWGSREMAGLKYTFEKNLKSTQATSTTLKYSLLGYCKKCFGY